MVESKTPWEPCSFTESVSLLLGLVYLISELVLTYSTSSRQALTRRSRTRFFASGASHCDTATDFSQATRLPLQSCGLMHRSLLRPALTGLRRAKSGLR